MQYAVNHHCTFRPLQGGIAITSATVGELGTLGLFGTDGTDTWLVSNYHVLCNRDLSQPFAPGALVYQPYAQVGAAHVAVLVAGKADPALDCAAARLLQPAGYEPRILGLGPVSAIGAPRLNQRVLKSGGATGVTEGRIASVVGDLVEIRNVTSASTRYNLSDIGDSGAVWIDAATREAVVLHNRTQDGQVEAAFGFALPAVMTALGLTLAP